MMVIQSFASRVFLEDDDSLVIQWGQWYRPQNHYLMSMIHHSNPQKDRKVVYNYLVGHSSSILYCGSLYWYIWYAALCFLRAGRGWTGTTVCRRLSQCSLAATGPNLWHHPQVFRCHGARALWAGNFDVPFLRPPSLKDLGDMWQMTKNWWNCTKQAAFSSFGTMISYAVRHLHDPAPLKPMPNAAASASPASIYII